jgi:CRP-like cAMP-binding protein
MKRYLDHLHHELACHQMSEYLEPVGESRINLSTFETHGNASPHALELRNSAQHSELNKALRQIPLLEGLQDSQIDYLVETGKRVTLSSGEPLFRRGDPAGCMYMILAGSIQIYMESDDGQVAMLQVLKSGQFFGEMAMLDGGKRSASALSLTPCVFFTLERASFLNLIATHPEMLIRLLSVLTERLRRTDERYLAQMAGVAYERTLQLDALGSFRKN